MIGLGRMGGNMTLRLLRAGHRVVVFDPQAEAVRALTEEGAAGAVSLAGLVEQLAQPRAVWVMVPAGRGHGEHHKRPCGAPEAGRHPDRRRQLQLQGQRPPC